MLDSQQHQASGLGSLAHTHSARLVALVNHGDPKTDLALLRRLCMSWVRLGYPVTVLDSQASESESSPGLEQLLEYAHNPPGSPQDASAWTVLPAAQGLLSLSRRAHTNDFSARLSGLFSDDGVVIVYGSAELLTELLVDKDCQPLMVVSSTPESLLTSYMALKRLVADGQMTPLIVDPSATPASHTSSTRSTLVDCARNFLNQDLKWVSLRPPSEDSDPTSDLQRMALRILENALPLCDRRAHMSPGRAKMANRQFSRSH